MELLFKRYFWAVVLAFIALAALFLARTTNIFVAGALEPAPNLGLDNVRTSIAPPAPQATVDTTRFGLLFGIEPPPPPPVDTAADAAKKAAEQSTAICFTCAPVKTNLRLQLLATMVANEKRWSMALITDLDKQTTDYYRVADPLKNAKVYDILREPQRVVIINDDTHRLEYIDGVPGSGAINTAGLGPIAQAPVPAPGGDAPLDGAVADNTPVEGIKQKSENEYSITRAKLDSTLGNLNEVATQARIVPSFKNGVANGFKLFSIRPGSLYSAIGVQNGDVISRINGFEMNSPDKALEIYQRLKDSKNIEIEVERRGQMVKKKYSIE